MNPKLVKARTQLVLSHPFFGCLLLNCKFIETEKVPTAATNGKDLLYNSEFINTLTNEEIMGLLVHEVCHKMFFHTQRLNERHPQLWNIATDFAINIIVKDARFILPAGGLYDDQFRGMTADEIYNILYEKMPKDPQGGKSKDKSDEQQKNDAAKAAGVNPDDVPDHMDGSEVPRDEASQREQEAEIKSQIAQAATLAKQSGKLPTGIEKLVGNLLQAKTNWRKEMRDFVQQTAKTDYTFRRPNRRTMAHDLYLPSLTGEEIGSIVIIFDSSGSIYGATKTVEKFVSEMNSIIEDCLPQKVVVFYADTRVVHTQELEKYETLVPEIKGGGGTAFSDSFKRVDALPERPLAVLYFTDLYVDDFGESDIPTMWCVYDNKNPVKPPFGRVIQLED